MREKSVRENARVSEQTEAEEDQEYWSVDGEPQYEGPITRSRVNTNIKALAKANILMDHYFREENLLADPRSMTVLHWNGSKIARGLPS